MKAKNLLTTLGAAMAAQMLGAGTCIVSGDPEAISRVGSCSLASEGASLVTGTFSTSCLAPSFDVRDWTRFATPGIGLKSTPWRGAFLVVW